MSRSDIAKVAATPVPYSMIVETAGNETFGEQWGSFALAVWKLNSGATHGKHWESLLKIDHAQVQSTTDPQVGQGRVTASSDQLRVSAAIANK